MPKGPPPPSDTATQEREIAQAKAKITAAGISEERLTAMLNAVTKGFYVRLRSSEAALNERVRRLQAFRDLMLNQHRDLHELLGDQQAEHEAWDPTRDACKSEMRVLRAHARAVTAVAEETLGLARVAELMPGWRSGFTELGDLTRDEGNAGHVVTQLRAVTGLRYIDIAMLVLVHEGVALPLTIESIESRAASLKQLAFKHRQPT